MVGGREVGAWDDRDVGLREEEFREDLGRGDGLARQGAAVGARDVGEEEERAGRVAVDVDARDVRERLDGGQAAVVQFQSPAFQLGGEVGGQGAEGCLLGDGGGRGGGVALDPVMAWATEGRAR
ncbi:hypothetical protein L1606_18715 [Streptomyces spororaveus]|nr:hypothetical protein [Streptomyces spororaveus]MCM9080088.1 hypothetical protein [Streptomyces spororaveus]